MTLKLGLHEPDEDRKSTYWASTSSDDAVKGQGIGDTKGDSSRNLRIDRCIANGFGLLIPEDGSSSGVDMRGTTVCERVDHVG